MDAVATSRAWPGFNAHPYREYSEVFFGPDYKVLRGGSWATHETVRRPTFRNWDYPIRRQIFSGFRVTRRGISASSPVMCRLLAYLGPTVTLESLVCAPPHGLVTQAYAPRHQRHGRINADGFGVGWYAPDVRAEPARYRTTTPMWADNSFASLAGVVSSGAVVATVRNASPGLPVDESCTAPYTHEGWLFAHNGRVLGFPGEVAVRLRRSLSDRRTAELQGVTDSEVLFALVLDRIDAGASARDAVDAVVREVLDVAPESRLNLCLSDGTTVVATACGDSLFTLTDRGHDAVVVASEPYDDEPGWTAVPEGSLVVATRTTLETGAMQ